MRIIRITSDKENFTKYLVSQFSLFLEHTQRVRDQYLALQQVNEGLHENYVLVQHSCQAADEIQSAYWNSTAVSLHPVVVYNKVSSD